MLKESFYGIGNIGIYLSNRPKSLFEEANEFGQYLVFAFGFIFSEVVSGRKINNRILLWLTWLLIVFFLVPNMSRGSWLGALAIVVIVFYYQNRVKLTKITSKRIVKISALFLIIIAVAFSFILQLFYKAEKDVIAYLVVLRGLSLFSGKDGTFLIRLESDIQAFETMLTYPFTGVGLGNIGTIYGTSISENIIGLPEDLIRTSSNFLLDIGAETGLVGFLSFIIFLILIFIKGTKTITLAKDDKVKSIQIGALASYMGILINGLSFSSHLLPFLWISIGILSTRIRINQNPSNCPSLEL